MHGLASPKKVLGQPPDVQEALVAGHQLALRVGHRNAVSRGLERGAEQRTRAGELHVGAHSCTHDRGVDRLGDEIRRAEFETVRLVFGRIAAGDEDDRDRCGGGVGLELLQHLVAVHVGHHDVEQHDVGRRGQADGQRLLAAGGHQHLMVAAERLMQRLDVQRLIIDQQHASLPRLQRGHTVYRVAKSTRPLVHELTSANN